MVAVTVWVTVSMTETVSSPLLTTYAFPPETTTPLGAVPVAAAAPVPRRAGAIVTATTFSAVAGAIRHRTVK